MKNRDMAIAFIGLGLFVAQLPAAETELIQELPFQITQPGVYQLAADLEFSEDHGTAIRIDADDVEIDFAGHTLTGTAGDSTAAIGVSAIDRKRLKIHGGAIRGFYFGLDIRATDRENPQSRGHTISQMKLERNRYFGIRLEGSDSVIESCRITDTGGSARPRHTIPHAVRLVGGRNILRDCCIRNMRLTRLEDGCGEIVGAHFDAAPDSRLENNHFIEIPDRDDTPIPAGDGKERRFAVWVNAGPQKNTFLRATGNQFYGWEVPFAFTPGTDGAVSKNVFVAASERPIRGKPAASAQGNRQEENAPSPDCPTKTNGE